MEAFCNIVVSRHLTFLAESFLCGVNGEYARVVTPYTFADNDAITVYVKEQGPGALRLTDLGGFLNHAASACGRDLMASMHERIVQTVARQDLMFERGEVLTFCTQEDVGEAMLRMAMAAKELDALTQLVRAHRVANFDARFGTLLRNKGAAVRTKQRVAGASGQEYTVDLVAEAGAQALIQTITSEQGANKIAMTKMAFEDFRDSGDARPRLAVVERVLAPAKMALLRKDADEVYSQDQVDNLMRDLRAAAV